MAKAEADKRICRVPVEPTVKVDTWWDLGIDDATAIWFVQDVGARAPADRLSGGSGEGLPQIVKRLDAKDYRYGRHILPHDAEARELGTGKSRIETLRSWASATSRSSAAGSRGRDQRHPPDALASAGSTRERCERGIEALKQYRREWDGKRQVWRERPLHDWTSHAADAFRYGALSRGTNTWTQTLGYDGSNNLTSVSKWVRS
jgi:phage terminase large subunit